MVSCEQPKRISSWAAMSFAAARPRQTNLEGILLYNEEKLWGCAWEETADRRAGLENYIEQVHRFPRRRSSSKRNPKLYMIAWRSNPWFQHLLPKKTCLEDALREISVTVLATVNLDTRLFLIMKCRE